MQENEFEKQVKNMMEEFQLAPSDTAWEKVSHRITEEKKRKRYFIFLLFFGLITAGVFGYFISEKNTKKLNAVTITNKAAQHDKDNIVSIDSNKNNSDKTLSATNDVVINDTATKDLKNDKTIFKDDHTSNKYLQLNSTINKDLRAYKKDVSVLKNDKIALQQNTSTPKKSNIVIADTNKILQQDSIVSTSLIITNDSSLRIAKSNNVDSSLIHTDSATNTLPATNAAVKKKESKTLSTYKIPKWQFGVNAMYGKSNLTSGLVSVDKALPSALGPLDSIAGRFDTSGNSKLYTASEAYSFGFVVQKKIFKTAVVGVGINYQHLSVKSHISNQVNAGYFLQSSNNTINYIINNYYRPGNASVFVNTYNFIEIPVYFQQDIFHTKKVSFSYNAGFSLRHLLSSKSLIYSEANNIYYFKDGLLHTTQVQLQGGLNVKFNTGKSTSIYIGPQVSYSLSKNFKNSNDGSFHFINYGLQAGLLLHKK